MSPHPNRPRPAIADTTVQRGWRIERIPGRPLHRGPDGRVILPLWLVKDGEHVTDGQLIMSSAEAESLCGTLCSTLTPELAFSHAPVLRLTPVSTAQRKEKDGKRHTQKHVDTDSRTGSDVFIPAEETVDDAR